MSVRELKSDHPRIRGEHARVVDPVRRGEGSSPHTRGARTTSRTPPRAWRIIPAYAGSTIISSPSGGLTGDHPRIRGEHGFRQSRQRQRAGSSPHTRGALMRLLADEDAVGIIPAYAGSTVNLRGVSFTWWDHPRIRGEHAGARAYTPSHPGSSPHTRGAQSSSSPRVRCTGIIPAYAGSTGCSGLGSGLRPDHPRIRGEHEDAKAKLGNMLGSSPHTRGARRDPTAHLRRSGIIPAYAGSTRSPGRGA